MGAEMHDSTVAMRDDIVLNEHAMGRFVGGYDKKIRDFLGKDIRNC